MYMSLALFLDNTLRIWRQIKSAVVNQSW